MTEFGYIGIDFGTTNIKAGLFDGRGGLLRLEKLPTPTVPDARGKVYDPAGIGSIVTEMLGKLTQCGVPIGGIAVTGMAEAGLMLHRETGTCLSAILPWFDPRTQALAQEVTEAENRRRFFRTGLRNSFKYGIYKYRWLLAETGIAPEETIWLSAADYVVYLLTGIAATDPTFAARTYAYDLETGDFDGEYLRSLRLTRENFPQVVPSGTRVGECILPELAGVSVHIAAHDHISAAFGMRFVDENAVCDSCGTAETYISTFPSRPLTETDWGTGCIFGPYPGGQNFCMANISSSGMAVEWYRKQLQLSELDYAQVNACLSEEKGPTGIFFLPALTGMGTPCFRQDMTASFLGLRQHHTGRSMLKAVVEGLGYQARMILEDMEVPGVISVGGAAESEGWMQTKADILGCTVITLAEKEATIMGAIALMLASHDTNAARKFCGGMKRGKVYPCQAEAYEAYAPLYRAYRNWFRLCLEQAASTGV